MTKSHHYGSSFIISAVLYAGLGVSLLALMKQPKVLKKEPEKTIKIAVITPIPKVIAPPIVTPIPPVVVPPKKVEKPKPKKIVKKKVLKKPKPKKIIKKKVIKKHKPKKKQVVKKIRPKPQPIVEEVYEEVPYIPTPAPVKVAPKRVVQTPMAAPSVDLEAKKRTFLNRVRSNILAHKKYPKMAKRRNIQGTVHATFDIRSNGTANNIQLSGASTILQKAVRKSILKSFPMAIPSELRSKFPMRSVSVNVDFILE